LGGNSHTWHKAAALSAARISSLEGNGGLFCKRTRQSLLPLPISFNLDIKIMEMMKNFYFKFMIE
jgi:hypothetical protein